MRNNKKGFTLTEIIIVIAVIAILVGVSFTVFTIVSKNNDKAEAYRRALEAYYKVSEENPSKKNLIIEVKIRDKEYIFVFKDDNLNDNDYDEKSALEVFGVGDKGELEEIEVDVDGVTVWSKKDTFQIKFYNSDGGDLIATIDNLREGDYVSLDPDSLPLTDEDRKKFDNFKSWKDSSDPSDEVGSLYRMPARNVNFTAEFEILATYWTDYGAYDTSWYNANDTEFTLSMPKQFAGLAYLVNNGNSFSGKTIKLGNDIDLSGTAYNLDGLLWTPIGTSSRTFKGTFDGQGHTISNMIVMIVNIGSCNVGLFGYTYGATIKNITLDSSCSVSSDAWYVGGIVGYANGGSIENVTNNGSVSIRSWFVGGIVGRAENSIIVNATNSGSVGNSDSVISSVGWFIGGIVGEAENSTIDNATNSGSVSSGGWCVGGIVGSAENSIIVNATNSGSVSSSSSGLYVGGIVGGTYLNELNKQGNKVYIINVVNLGDISGYKYVTGICCNDEEVNLIICNYCNTSDKVSILNKGSLNITGGVATGDSPTALNSYVSSHPTYEIDSVVYTLKQWNADGTFKD